LLVVTSVVVLWLTAPAVADGPPPPPQSFREVAPGGRFVFVMIAPLPADEDARGHREETAAEIRRVRGTYARSGMYRNDGSAEPLWTVDWYAFNVEPAADGQHLVRRGQWAWLQEDGSPDLDCEAVSFFADGQLLRTYRVGELVQTPGRLPRSVSHYQWRERNEGGMCGEHEYTLTTSDGSRLLFDLRTGEIVSRAWVIPPEAWVWVAVMSGSVVAVAVLGWAVRRWSRLRNRKGLRTGRDAEAGVQR
jgi:hypothetical protein